MHLERITKGLIAGLLVAVLGASLPAGAASAPDAEGLLRVVSPTRGQGVFSGGETVEVVVARGARLKVESGFTNITSRLGFKVVRHNSRTRTLRGKLTPAMVPRDVPTALRFTATAGSRKDADSVLVQRVNRSPRFLTVGLLRNSRTAPVVAVVKTTTHRIWWRASLNGRRIESTSRTTGTGQRRLHLTAAEGLRPGRNVLEVATKDRHGRGDVKRVVFTLPRTAVIPTVAHQRQVRVRNTVHLDARDTLVPKGAGVTYEWKIVSRPRGSRAALNSRSRSVNRFRPDRPGHYRVRLTARRTGTPAAAGDATQMQTASASAPASSSVIVNVAAQPPIPASGYPLSIDPSSGITYNGTNYPIPGGAGGAGAMVVVIDSSTGQVTQTKSVPALGQYFDYQTMVDYLGGGTIGSTDIVAVAFAAGPRPDSQWDALQQSVFEFQVSVFGLSDGVAGNDQAGDVMSQVADAGPAAFVGQFSLAPGQAVSNVSDGKIDGRLRMTATSGSLESALTFQQPDFRLFSLNGPYNASMVSPVNPPVGAKSTIPIDNPLANPDESATSMWVTVMDAVTLDTVATAGSTSDGKLDAVFNLLNQYQQDTTKLVLFKMAGTSIPTGQDGNATGIAQALAHMNANHSIILRSFSFPENNGYAGYQYVFFGGAGVTTAVEGSPIIGALTTPYSGGNPPLSGLDDNSPMVAVSSPQLTGIMRRDHQSRWVPMGPRTNDLITQPMQAVAAQPSTSFTYPTSPSGTRAQYAGAETQLFNLMIAAGVMCTPGPDCSTPTGVRTNYGNREFLSSLPAAATAIKCSQTGSLTPTAGASYTKGQLTALQTMVCGEIQSLTIVHDKLFDQMSGPDGVYANLETDSTLDLLSYSSAYIGFLKEKQDSELAKTSSILGITGNAGVILADLFTAGTTIAGYLLAPETGGSSIFAAESAGNLFTVASDVLSLASTETQTSSADQVAPTDVTVGTLFKYIQDSYGEAQESMFELEQVYATDPTKLAYAVAQVESGKWDLQAPIAQSSPYVGADLVTYHMRLASMQYMLPRMLMVSAKACDTGGSSSDPTTYETWTHLQYTGDTWDNVRHYRLRSVHLNSDAAQTLGSWLFASPLYPGAQPLINGPESAAIPFSPFFMQQVAPTTVSTSQDCLNYTGG